MAHDLTVKIDMTNAAFCDAPPEYEVARILRELADKLEDQGLPANRRLHDYNGAACGTARTTGKPAK